MSTKNMKLASTLLEQMVEIPKGRIELRDDRTKEQWTVEIEPFLLHKFPVTQGFSQIVKYSSPLILTVRNRSMLTCAYSKGQ